MNKKEEILKILEELKGQLRTKYKVKKIGLFGSFVRGEEKKTSDVDILVEFEEVPDLFKFLELERHLEEILKVKVDLVRKEVVRKELKEKILGEAIEV